MAGNLARHLPNRFEDAHGPKVPQEVHTIGELHNHIEAEHERRRKKPLVEETHCRVTFLLDRKLRDKLDAICEKKEKGFRTLLYNRAIEAVLREYAEFD